MSDALGKSVRDLLPKHQVRPERAAMERAILGRIVEYFGEAIAVAPLDVLERALAERTDERGMADVLAFVLLRAPALDDWAAALQRGAQRKRELLDEAGGGLTA